MNATIRDAAALRQIRVADLVAYLRATGWAEERRINGQGAIWTQRDDEGQTVGLLVPLHRDLADYATRLAEVMTTLEQVERRSQLEVFDDVTTTLADRLRLPLHTAHEEGSIGLERGAAVVNRTKDLLQAAACAAVDPRQVYSSRRPDQVNDYLSRVRLGQTERGSYVLTVLSPLPPVLQPPLPETDAAQEEPFERRVTRTLAQALAGIGRAAERATVEESLVPFEEAVAHGVSANLCEAVVDLVAMNEERGLDLMFTRSPTRPARELPQRVHVPSDAAATLREVSRVFRERTPVEGVDLEGFVVGLQRGTDDPIGVVTVKGVVEGRLRPVRIELASAEYDVAVRAHGERRSVLCTGDIAREGRSYSLRYPRNFGLAPEEA